MKSIEDVKAAFPDLKWRDSNPQDGGRVSFAICGGDRETGDITVLLAMSDGARAPLHIHHPRDGWPFRESITCLIGRVFGVDLDQPSFVLYAGQTIDLNSDKPHQPSVDEDEFALMTYRQPAGSMSVL